MTNTPIHTLIEREVEKMTDMESLKPILRQSLLSIASEVAQMFKSEERHIFAQSHDLYNMKVREVNTLADSIINANKE